MISESDGDLSGPAELRGQDPSQSGRSDGGRSVSEFRQGFTSNRGIALPAQPLQVAARMVGAFSTFRQYDTRRQEQMQAQLQRIVAQNGLSENVLEIASKSLAV